MKNLVGINGDKNYLPHFRIGAPKEGGDEFPDTIGKKEKIVFTLKRKLIDQVLTRNNIYADVIYSLAQKFYHTIEKPLGFKTKQSIKGGDWHGNDTTWRMTLDLNRILFNANKKGKITAKNQRRFFSLIDGIVAGEGEGPLVPTARECGVLIAGFNPLPVDLVATRLMGFDYQKIPLLDNALHMSAPRLWNGTPEAIEVKSNVADYTKLLSTKSSRYLNLKPSAGWINHIEI
jgi:hypothetical protein